MENSELNGAWEEKGVIGIRIEIDEPNITVLWRNSPVLTTTFQRKEEKEGMLLKLKRNGLRYDNSTSDYATISKLLYHDGNIEMEEYFPITGESKTTLSQTTNSRYGNYTIVDEILAELAGDWKDENGFYELHFEKDTLTLNEHVIKVHVLHANGEEKDSNHYFIVNQDPSQYELYCLTRLEYHEGKIWGCELILDATPSVVEFRKIT